MIYGSMTYKTITGSKLRYRKKTKSLKEENFHARFNTKIKCIWSEDVLRNINAWMTHFI
jgi:hypothetical protein